MHISLCPICCLLRIYPGKSSLCIGIIDHRHFDKIIFASQNTQDGEKQEQDPRSSAIYCTKTQRTCPSIHERR